MLIISCRPDDKPENLTTDLDVALQNAVRNANRGGPYIMGMMAALFSHSLEANHCMQASLLGNSRTSTRKITG